MGRPRRIPSSPIFSIISGTLLVVNAMFAISDLYHDTLTPLTMASCACAGWLLSDLIGDYILSRN